MPPSFKSAFAVSVWWNVVLFLRPNQMACRALTGCSNTASTHSLRHQRTVKRAGTSSHEVDQLTPSRRKVPVEVKDGEKMPFSTIAYEVSSPLFCGRTENASLQVSSGDYSPVSLPCWRFLETRQRDFWCESIGGIRNLSCTSLAF